jgi:hypothetical protein
MGSVMGTCIKHSGKAIQWTIAISGMVVGTVDLIRNEFIHSKRVDPVSDHASAQTIFESCKDQRTNAVNWRSFGYCLSDAKQTLGLGDIEEFDVFSLVDLALSTRDHDGDGSLDLAEFKSSLDSICCKFIFN